MISEKSSHDADVLVPVVEEEVHVGKRRVVTGKVRIGTELEVVSELASATLEEHEVTVERVPVDRPVTEIPQVRTEGDVTIVPVLEEIMVIEKRLVLKEELHIRRQVTAQQMEVPVMLKKQRAVIERVDVQPNPEEHHQDGHD